MRYKHGTPSPPLMNTIRDIRLIDARTKRIMDASEADKVDWVN
jgi:hypothetical protein